MGNTCSSRPKEVVKSEDNEEDRAGIVRYLRDVPPSHYLFKVESFSSLPMNSLSEFQSGVFESGGYKWKLALHSHGYQKGITFQGRHISLNLVITETDPLPSGWELNVFFRGFLFDQIRDKYLTVEATDWKYRRFHAMKKEWGLSNFIPHSMLRTPGNGYIVKDTCVFGAEVFVYKSSGQGDCLSVIEGASPHTQIWKIERFSELKDEHHSSEVFTAGGQKWRICLFPKGEGESKNKNISVFLVFVGSDSAPSLGKVYTQFLFRVKDQKDGSYIQGHAQFHYFCASKSSAGLDLIGLDTLNKKGNGFLVNDACIIEADVTVRAVVNPLP